MDKDIIDISKIQLPDISPKQVLPRLGGKLFMDKDATGVMPLLPLETLRGLTGSAASQNQGDQQ